MKTEIQKRKFLGKTDGYLGKDDRKHNQKALKAYLSGKRKFRNGFETHPILGRQPVWFDTPIQDRIIKEN